MKILLIAPVHSQIRPGQFLAPPIGLYRIKSYIEKKLNHILIDVLDTNLYYGEIPSFYLNQNYNIIGSSLLEGTFQETIKIQEILISKNSQSIAICGGHGVTGRNIELILTNYTILDYAIIGLGEFPLLQILENFQSTDLKAICGIAYRTFDKKIKINQSSPIDQQDFDELCQIDYSSIPYEDYWNFNLNLYTSYDLKIMKNSKTIRAARINTSTHCNSGCTFCSATNFFSNCIEKQKVINQSPDSIIETITNILKHHPKTETIFFNDDNFINSKKKIIELSIKVQKNEMLKKVNFICLSRLDTISVDILKLLKAMNVYLIIYGLESFDERIIKIMNKSTSKNYISKCKRNIISTMELGIIPLINIILFHPKCKIESVIKTIEESLTFINKGVRVGLNILIEVFEGSFLTVEKDSFEILKMSNHEFFLPDDEFCNTVVKKYFSECHTLHDIFERDIDFKINNNLLLKNIEIFYSIYTILNLETNHMVTLTKSIIHNER
jgi:radical SAM superfamily enzyme YgiQ (UPF0313 family)